VYIFIWAQANDATSRLKQSKHASRAKSVSIRTNPAPLGGNTNQRTSVCDVHSDYAEQIAKLTQKLARTEAAGRRVSEILRDSEEEVATARQLVSELEEAKLALNLLHGAIVHDNGILMHKLCEKEAEKSELSQKEAAATLELAGLGEKLSANREEFARMDTELAAFRMDAASLRTNLAELVEKLAGKEKELAGKNAEFAVQVEYFANTCAYVHIYVVRQC